MKIFPSRQDSPEMLWQRLSSANLAQGEMPKDLDKGDHSPWYVHAMLFVAAWISVSFFLVFIFLAMAPWLRSAWARGIVGVIACGAAFVYFNARQSRRAVFIEQIVFIVALIGQALVLTAIFDGVVWKLSTPFYVAWLGAALFGTVVWAAIDYAPNRFLSASLVIVSLYNVFSLFPRGGMPPFVWGSSWLFMALCLAALAVVLHHQWRALRLWPVVALALSLVPLFVMGIDSIPFMLSGNEPMGHAAGWGKINIGQICLILVWLGIVHALLKQVTGKPWARENAGVWLIALLLAAGTWPVPAALFALAVYFLGFSQRDKLLQGIGIVQLLWAVGYYYYSLSHTLLFKSQMLAALGLALLLVYAASHFLFPAAQQGGEKA